MFRHTLPLRTLVVIMALSLGIATLIAHSALAAELSNGIGTTCAGDGSIGTWHFVNNQNGGATSGTLTAVFSCGTEVVGESKVTGGTIHFNVTTEGDCELLSASTNLPGRLQLSDSTCTPKK